MSFKDAIWSMNNTRLSRQHSHYSDSEVSNVKNIGSLHWKGEINIASEIGLMGTVVFPKGEHVT